jgi:hypothetical protein
MKKTIEITDIIARITTNRTTFEQGISYWIVKYIVRTDSIGIISCEFNWDKEPDINKIKEFLSSNFL